ncbi:MAG TPA: tRNA lysidine(34) synthetase TilS [Acetobacteraceae bacterium]|nr:tRNA lysidine(34) synthetase TilS [Acetobacteraceae bacterium]
MGRLGPWSATPRLAAAVSGGGDSLALAVLAADWVAAHGGTLLALIVDHGLRPGSAGEAGWTAARLAERGIPARILSLGGLAPGPGLPARARVARYAALAAACREAGRLHLLLGHQAMDQAETWLMRRERGSGPAGLAAMPALAEQHDLRLLRPLLGLAPERLRATLRASGLSWVEDPTNANTQFLRPRLRATLRLGGPTAAGAACREAAEAGLRREAAEAACGAVLARAVTLRPEGFALLPREGVPPAALAALLQAIAGAPYPPSADAVAGLADSPRAATLAGARLLPAARLGPGWLLVREAAAMAPPVPARPGALWDGRFRLSSRAAPPLGATLGALGDDAARLRRHSPLPAVVLRTLPAIRLEDALFAVPHLGYPDPRPCCCVPVAFAPTRPASGAPFQPGEQTMAAMPGNVTGGEGHDRGCEETRKNLCC